MSKANYLAIVTARSQSKRLPNKNSRDLCGHPLFLWSVKVGMECPLIKDTIVTTDSVEYQALALAAGASCPWLREADISADETSSADVVRDVLNRYGNQLASFKGLVLLQPTSPLRTVEDITAAIRLHANSGAPAVVSISEAECPPAWVGQVGADLLMDSFIRPDLKGLRSQDLGTWYRLNGAIYVIGIEEFLSEHGFMPKGTLAYKMPRERSIDIDTEYDFELARFAMGQRLKNLCHQ